MTQTPYAITSNMNRVALKFAQSERSYTRIINNVLVGVNRGNLVQQDFLLLHNVMRCVMRFVVMRCATTHNALSFFLKENT